jgi:CubicO group peptidase (beta-lactamase class C family)
MAALKAFNVREYEQGARFHYASSQTVVLTVLLRAVTGTSLSEYLTPRLWQPLGAEADAAWVRTRDGTEAGSGNFNATLRDYGRLGVLLANDGALGDRQIIPKDYLMEATDWHRQPEAFRPKRATPFFGYGYQFWMFPGERRRFALLGVYGQSIFVDPELKLVMVITGAARNASVGKESFARERSALWRGIVAKYGSW